MNFKRVGLLISLHVIILPYGSINALKNSTTKHSRMILVKDASSADYNINTVLHVQPVIETSRQIYSKRSAAFKKASKQVRMQSFSENKFQARSESHIIIDISETVNVCPCLQKFISTCMSRFTFLQIHRCNSIVIVIFRHLVMQAVYTLVFLAILCTSGVIKSNQINIRLIGKIPQL